MGVAGAGAAGEDGAEAGNAGATGGTDAVLHDLATGRSRFIGSIGESEFNRTGELLAYSVEAAVDDGNGLFLIHLADGRTDVLDNDSLHYARLTWNDRGTGLAVLKGHDVEKKRERNNQLLVFTDLGGATKPAILDTSAAGFPKGFMLSERAPLAWSDDGKQRVRRDHSAVRARPTPPGGRAPTRSPTWTSGAPKTSGSSPSR